METSEAMYDSLRTTLEEDCLLHHGGIEDVSLRNILTNDNNDDDQLHRQPTIISHSSYYDIKNLIPVSEKNKGFSILSSNIQSINAKISELKIFVEELREKGSEFQLMCLQETWLKEKLRVIITRLFL